jgi:hypothetical protein
MGYALRAGVSFCVAGGRTVFLDREADRYFCLPPDADAVFLRAVDDGEISGNQADALASTGAMILVETDHPVALRPCPAPPVPQMSLLDLAPRATAHSVAAAVSALLLTTVHLKFSSMPVVLDRLERRKRRPCGAVDTVVAQRQLVDWTGAFRTCETIIAARDRCLLRSLALMSHLLARGHRPDLVFGVTIRPFAAHCWVQQGHVVLNDRADAVATYTPILVI